MRNLKLTKLKDTSVFRKIAMGTWKTAKDPSVYAILDIDVTKAIPLMKEYSKKHNIKITPSHLVGRAVARCMQIRPEINGMIRGSRIYLRDSVTLFYQVNIPGKGDDKIKKATLSGLTIENAETKSVLDISKEISDKAEKVVSYKDKDITKNLNTFKLLPWWFAGIYLNIASWLLYGLNLNLSWLGLPRDPFGSVMISNLGTFGVDMALIPLCPYTRVPLLLSVGKTSEKPVVIDGKVVVRTIMPLGVTFDHRLVDGIHASHMGKIFKESFEDPEKYLFN